MRWASHHSTAPSTRDAIGETIGAVASTLGGEAADLVVVFFTPEHSSQARELAAAVMRRWPQAVLVGCSASGVIGGGKERESGPALSLTAAHLPNVAIRPFAMRAADLPHGTPEPADWPLLADVDPETDPAFLLLVEPYSMRAELLAGAMDASWPRCTKVGGLASGAGGPGGNVLILGNEVHRAGVVGVVLTGDVEVDPLVAQGARPIGPTFVVTRARENLIFELDGRPAIPQLEELFVNMPPRERDLFRRSPMIGLAATEGEARPRAGDFLIRNLIGLDRERGAVGVAWPVEDRQVIQFHLRDAGAAAEELHELVARRKGLATEGALLFSCVGRGEGFFGGPDHDSGLLTRLTGCRAIGGFFCNGEIGPVRGHTYVHGYTSSFAVFRARGWD